MSGAIDSRKANAECVGPASEAAGKAASCAGCPNARACASGAGREVDETPMLVRDRLKSVKHKIVVLSGKGGVGKSTVSCQLAFALAAKGHAVGLLDVDICGPSVPRMLGLMGRGVHRSSSGWSPVYVDSQTGELAVMSVGFMLPDDDNAVIWRGPRKNGLIKQFLSEVDWGELDYLIIDTPPGTSDEHISIASYLKLANVSGAVVVTTPQEISMQDVRKELNFCVKTSLPVLGVLENMATVRASLATVRFVDAHGGDASAAVRDRLGDLFDNVDVCVDAFASLDASNGPRAMATKFKVPYLGALPLDPELTRACEAGRYFVDAKPTSPAAEPFRAAVETILHGLPP